MIPLLELEGNLRGQFTQIALLSKESLIEQSSKAGNRVRVNIRNAFRASKTQWSHYYDKHGNRRIYKARIPRRLGRRVSHKGGGGTANPESMENFITSFTMETTGTTVIGGGHKAFTPNRTRDGKIVGTLPRVQAVSQASLAILEKLNTGKQNKDLRWRTKAGGQSAKSIAQFKGKWVKGRFFMERGYTASISYVRNSLTVELEQLIGKRVNNMRFSKVKNAL